MSLRSERSDDDRRPSQRVGSNAKYGNFFICGQGSYHRGEANRFCGLKLSPKENNPNGLRDLGGKEQSPRSESALMIQGTRKRPVS